MAKDCFDLETIAKKMLGEDVKLDEMEDIEIKKALWKWMTQVLGIEVIFADQTAPRPKKPYGTIRLNYQSSLGICDEASHPDDEVVNLNQN